MRLWGAIVIAANTAVVDVLQVVEDVKELANIHARELVAMLAQEDVLVTVIIHAVAAVNLQTVNN